MTRQFLDLLLLAIVAVVLPVASATTNNKQQSSFQHTTTNKHLDMHNELLSKATLVEDRRNLEGNDDFYGDNGNNNAYSFTGYSLKYTKCQPVQYFSSDAIEAGEHSPMITEDIVLLRLCPACSSNSLGCHYNYADYAITVSEYVRILLKYSAIRQEIACNYCQACGYAAAADDDQANRRRKLDQEEQDQENDQQQDDQAQAQDDFYQEDNGANGNYEDCSMIDSICPNYTCQQDQQDENNYLDFEGYLDYLDCVQVDYNEYAYFVRPRCDGESGTIKMAVFYDNYCGSYAGSEVSAKDLGLGFREGFFQEYYSGECIDCSESDQAPFYNLNSALCNKIHGDAAKCTGNLLYDLFDGEQEDSTECSYIESLRYGTYDSKGKLSSANGMIDWDTEVTRKQLLLLIVTAIFVVFFLVYACYLHHSMTNLLIKSLSHRELLPPSRHTKRPIV